MKIVGVGLNKTGTTTLGICLKYWGFRHISVSKEAFQLFVSRDITALMNMAENYDSFEDWPWALLYKEFDHQFPDSKFILTKRKSAEAWFDSLCRHAERTGPTLYRQHIYGHAMPHEHKEDHIWRYEEHNAAVETYFKDRPEKLMIVCWETGGGWKELSGFLGLEPPSIRFPHANRRTGRYIYRVKKLTRRAIGRKRYTDLADVARTVVGIMRRVMRRL